jgi:hypothetical protein
MPQFLIRDSDLKNFYDCIKGDGEISDALLLLSKPEDEVLPRERVYNDILILTLTDDQLEELITSIAEENDSSAIMVTLSRSVKNGLAVRGEENSENDENDENDEDDEEWNPGDFGHPLNADGSSRQAKQIEGYCVSCKVVRTFDGFLMIAASGRGMVQGGCPVCNTRMSKVLE